MDQAKINHFCQVGLRMHCYLNNLKSNLKMTGRCNLFDMGMLNRRGEWSSKDVENKLENRGL